MRNKRKLPFESKPVFAVVIDGETEFWYFQMLKRNERKIQVDIKPEIPQKKSVQDQYQKCLEIAEIYDKVFWIIDLDVVLLESTNTKGGEKPIDFILRIRNQWRNENVTNLSMIINQPCLEFWFLTHFHFTSRTFKYCSVAQNLLSKYLSNYEKSQRFFTSYHNDIYARLKPNLNTALTNSEKFEDFDPNSPFKGLTEMNKLFKEIGIGFDSN